MLTRFAGSERFRNLVPEIALAVIAGAVFLGYLGSVDLWGKREQRASAEAIDTIDHNHWLVAQIQGRPRLEKPPLPRWTIAALMTLTGRRDEWMVRLPSALSAMGMVGLVYGLGKRIGGRPVGLASGLALTSMGFFISELRQAGNDGPLAFFTTLALYSAWRRLHGENATMAVDAAAPAGSRRWNLLFYLALGLGFLCKGPIAVILVAMTVVPYLACARQLRRGLGLLADGRGGVLFLFLALCWPVPVLLNDPNAARVWLLEMGQKAGTAGIAHSRRRLPLAVDWPWLTIPWAVIATMAVVLPFLKRGREFLPKLWFPWWWAAGNLVMFCAWSVAKPNYFLPCLPGAALLCGIEWVRLTQSGRMPVTRGNLSRLVLQFHWVVIFVGSMVIPVIIHQTMPAMLTWSVVFAIVMAASVVVSAWTWHRGATAGALGPLVGGLAFGVLIGYGAIAPAENDRRSHRALAAALDHVLPANTRTIMFFHEIDEGLWFYLRDREIVPVPGSQPEYNDAVRLAEDLKTHGAAWDWKMRNEVQLKILLSWLSQPGHESPYVLIRDKEYAGFATALKGVAEPVYREQGLKRNALVLLHVTAPEPVAAATAAGQVRRN